ncbi:hypothetical protein HpBGD38_14560 [Helicobacter pylori]
MIKAKVRETQKIKKKGISMATKMPINLLGAKAYINSMRALYN